MNLIDIYREEILDHWQNPQNWGKIVKADMVIDQINPLCGDQVTFYFKINEGKVIDVSFTGKGCAISIASASMLSEFIKDKRIKYLSKITGEDVLQLIGGPATSLGFPPARLKCVFLALEAVRKLNAESLTTKANRSVSL